MRLRAYAKINLTLDIVGRKSNGYHLINSVFQSIDLFDIIDVQKSDKTTVVCECVCQSDNIAYKAAKEFFTFTGINGGANISIEKRIPLLSGLGGGSADAAAVITALDKIYKTNLNSKQLAEIALKCGADVPFFIFGGTAVVGGIGEKVEPVAPVGGFYAVLVKADEKQSTADMYKKLDSMPPQKNLTEEFLITARENGYGKALENIGNAFSAVAKNEAVFDALKSQNPIAVSISGSGPTHFALFNDKTAAKNAEKKLKKRGFKPIIAPFTTASVEVID